MLFRKVQLVCSLLAFSVFHSAHGQAIATATENGIVSAAGGPQESSSVTYSIQGEGVAATTASSDSLVSMTSSPSTVATGGTVLDGSNSSLTDGNDHPLSTAAILGIVAAVVLSIVGILIVSIILYRRKSHATNAAISAAKRKSIMDLEFAASKLELGKCMTETRRPSDEKKNLGYFDLAKPLPAVTSDKAIDDDRLSRSSTIIAADAAEVAQINRKASLHQTKQKKSREQQRERNQALKILITNEENRTSRYSMSSSPLASNPTTPVDLLSARCPDGNGDAFAKRPSKL